MVQMQPLPISRYEHGVIPALQLRLSLKGAVLGYPKAQYAVDNLSTKKHGLRALNQNIQKYQWLSGKSVAICRSQSLWAASCDLYRIFNSQRVSMVSR